MTGPAEENLKRSILNHSTRLERNDPFCFSCKKDLPCFNQCCSDVNIALAPYDIIRLKNAFGISSGDFLDRYCVMPFSQRQHFPVVLLRMSDDAERACQFVGPEGCSVYDHRPWACRMYPIGVASPSDDNPEEAFFFAMKEKICQGHTEAKKWTIQEWIDDQGAGPYEQLGEEFKQISLHPYFRAGRQLSPEGMDMLIMVLYDLDRFRRFLFESSFLRRFDIEKLLLEQIETSDVELLRFGFRWLRLCLFNEKTLRIKEDGGLKRPDTASFASGRRSTTSVKGR